MAHVLPPVFPRVYKQRTLFFIIIEERWGVLVLEPIEVDLTACCAIYRNTVLLLGVAQGRGRVGGDNIRDRGALRLELGLVIVVRIDVHFTICNVLSMSRQARRPRGRRRRRLLSDFDLGRSRDRNRGDGGRRIRAQVFLLVAR